MNKEEKHARTPRSKGIAGTYMHIAEVPNGLSLEIAQIHLQEDAYGLAFKLFGPKVLIKVRLEEGSLKAWVFVGSMALYNVVGSYGSFRSGIDQIVVDAKIFSEYLADQFQEDMGVPEEALLRFERRLGVPGKIQRFYKQLDKLNDHDLDHHDRTEMLNELKSEFMDILELLEDRRDRELFIEEVPSEISRPDVPKPEPIRGVIDLAILRDEEEWHRIPPDRPM